MVCAHLAAQGRATPYKMQQKGQRQAFLFHTVLDDRHADFAKVAQVAAMIHKCDPEPIHLMVK